MSKIGVGVLGAAGMVGQRFLQLLQDHPMFEVVQLFGSDRTAGKKYGEVVRWQMDTDLPSGISEMVIEPIDLNNMNNMDCEVLFSALPSEEARKVEPQLAQKGYKVFTNASALRMDPYVPLIIPFVNHDHIHAIEEQRKQYDWKGFVVANPNCSSTPVVISLKRLHEMFGVKKIIVTTLQAVSGAGYPGVPSLDILGNVIPYISGEEEKVETEPLKMLGVWEKPDFRYADISISAHTNRVPVKDGHLVTISVEFDRPVSQQEILDAWENWQPPVMSMNLPSLPPRPLIYKHENDRPQPVKDVMTLSGMGTVVGRLRPCKVLDWKYIALAHNTIIGAAGCSILNAELYYATYC